MKQEVIIILIRFKITLLKMQGTCMINRAIDLSTSNIILNVDLIGFIGFRGSELKVELWWMDNSFQSETFFLVGKSIT